MNAGARNSDTKSRYANHSSKKRKRVIISGAGLFGTTVFSFLAEHQNIEVMLLEAGSKIGGGSTRKNHGRIHCGATGVFSDPPEVTERKIQGNSLIIGLDLVMESNSPAIYCCNLDDHSIFNRGCLERKISVSHIYDYRKPFNVGNWVEKESIGQCYSVPEFSFDPADLAYRISDVGVNRNGRIFTNTKVLSVNRLGRFLSVKCKSLGDLPVDIDCDIFINCNSKYANSIQFEDQPGLVDLEFFRWPVMAIRSNAFKKTLHQVIVVVDTNNVFPSIIPHRDTITFDAKTIPLKVETPDSYPKINPKRFDPDNEQENSIFNAIRSTFRPFAGLNIDDFKRNVTVFYGVHGRRKGETETSDISHSFRYPGIENYVVRHGGLATTAILDAIETVEEIEGQIRLSKTTPSARMARLNRDLNQQRKGLMIWDDDVRS